MKQKIKDRRRRRRADKVHEQRVIVKAQRVDQRRVLGCKVTVLAGYSSGERVNSRGKVEEQVKRRNKFNRVGKKGSVTEVRNRCVISGNGRSVRRWFRKSGRQVREMARRGKLEGVYRISW